MTCQTRQGNLGGNLPASAGRELQYGDFGKAEGATPAQCEKGLVDHELTGPFDAVDLNAGSALLVKGDTLCVKTSADHLAVLKITDVKSLSTPAEEKVPAYTRVPQLSGYLVI